MQTVLWNEEVTEKNPVFPGQLQIYCYEHIKKKTKTKTTFHCFTKKKQEQMLTFRLLNNQ